MASGKEVVIMFVIAWAQKHNCGYLGKLEVTLEAIKSSLSGIKMNMLTENHFLQRISLMHTLTAEDYVVLSH